MIGMQIDGLVTQLLEIIAETTSITDAQGSTF
jgi:hypothetical protein